MCISESKGYQFEQVSFVNSICTLRGGTHVEKIANQISDKIIAEIKKYIEENKHKSGRNKSNLLYDAARAYLEGLGFRSRFKPNAWAATVAADFHVRGAKKKNRKGRTFRRNRTEM